MGIFKVGSVAIFAVATLSWITGLVLSYTAWAKYRNPSEPWYKCLTQKYFVYNEALFRPEGQRLRQYAVRAFAVFLASVAVFMLWILPRVLQDAPKAISLLYMVLAAALLIGLLVYRFRGQSATRPPLRGMPVKELEKLLDKVGPLFDTNPGEAQRILEEASAPYEQREREEMRLLWARAPHDPAAARRLHDLIKDDLETDRLALKEMSTASNPSPTRPEVLADIRAAIESDERKLAMVEGWLKK